mgnify:CR=1 FL=1
MGGPDNQVQEDENIINNLGLGIIRFSAPDPEPPKESDVTYRCDTEVITSVLLSTDSQKTPDSPAYAASPFMERRIHIRTFIFRKAAASLHG